MTASFKKDDPLTSELGISLGIHLLVIAMVFFKVVLFPGEPLVINPAIRVDIVDLPDKNLHPANEPAAPAPPQQALPTKPIEQTAPAKPIAEPKPTAPKVALPDDKLQVDRKAQKSALERIKALQAIENQMQEEQAHAHAKPLPTYKGPALTTGNAPTGAEKIQLDEYLEQVEAHVKRNWILPQWLKGTELTAQVHVQIDANGIVIKKQIKQSSNNSMYDDKVLETIDRASPFPKPPEKFARRMEISGVDFAFP